MKLRDFIGLRAYSEDEPRVPAGGPGGGEWGSGGQSGVFYHGSPNKFDRFNTGTVWMGDKATATKYVTSVMPSGKGHLYTVQARPGKTKNFTGKAIQYEQAFGAARKQGYRYFKLPGGVVSLHPDEDLKITKREAIGI
jgi:hypothetical protein